MDRKEYNKKYYLEHRELLLARANKYIDENRDKVYAYNKEYAKKLKKSNFKIEQNVSVRFI